VNHRPAGPSQPSTSDADPRPKVEPWRLISTLALAGAIAGLAIVLVNQWAEPRIQAHRAAALQAAIQEVLGGPDSYQTLWVGDSAVSAEPPVGADTAALDRVYLGHDRDGRPVGFAVEGELPGYQDIIGLIFGYDATSGEVIGMKILESKETPGLGDKIEKDSAFVASFESVSVPIEGVKARSGTGSPGEVDMITGATISSRTVIAIINERLDQLRPLLDAYREPDPAPEGPAVEEGPVTEAGSTGPTGGLP